MRAKMRSWWWAFVGPVAVAAVITCTVRGCSAWREFEKGDRQAVEERERRAVEAVKKSRLGAKQMRDDLASDYFEEVIETGECKWSGYATWNGEPKNPNWFSSAKGANGFLVECEATALNEDKDERLIRFQWDVSDDRGVEGFRWGLSPMDEWNNEGGDYEQ